MNKQQLAAKIWESANQMRSKIEANEYKDYILGFIFYKYLSDQLGSVDLCCTNVVQQYIGSHININASDTILA
ncbi:hypothetical protein A1L58_20965 [Shewanella baltica]|nr:hypothetical protein A1L58_20965 [Shewanella baltica]